MGCGVVGDGMGWGNGICAKAREGKGCQQEMLSAAGATI